MIKKIVLLTLLACLSYLIALIVYMPVSFAWDQARRWLPVQQLPVKVNGTAGTLWDGDVLVRQSQLAARISWELHPWQALLGQPALNLDVVSGEATLTGEASIRSSDLVDVSGRLSLDLKALNPLLRQHRLDLAGLLTVRNLNATIDRNTGVPTSVSGQAHWEGGMVSYPMGRDMQTTEMPALVGRLTQQGNNLALDVSEEASGNLVMQAQLAPDGVAKIQIRRRLLDLAGAPWSGNSGPDDIVFRIQQKVI